MNSLTQYPITRNEFTDIISEEITDSELLFDNITWGTKTDTFILSLLDDEVLIFHTDTCKFVNWYKLTHVGRCLRSNLENVSEYREFFKILNEELQEVK